MAVMALERTQEREGEEWRRSVAELHDLVAFVASNVECYRFALVLRARLFSRAAHEF
jgi:hypothetical protein